MRFIRCLVLVLTLGVGRTALVAAQDVGPRLDALRSGAAVVAPAAPDEPLEPLEPLPVQDRRSGVGKPAALMAVGVAGLVIGGLVRDDAGAIIMVAGGIVGLYGLVLWLQRR